MTDLVEPAVQDAREPAQDWPLRPWLLAGLIGLAGLLIHLVTHDNHDTGWRVAVAAFLLFAPISAALSVERDDWRGPAIFSVVLGLIMAGLAWRAVQYGEYLPDEQYGLGAGVVASLLALPLFQAGFLKQRFATPYAQTHYHVWNDAIAGAGAIAFTGLSWLVLLVLSELFHLLKIDLIRDLMNEEWFGWTFSGTAFGAALGTLKNQAKVLGTLQNVVMLVLSLLAVPLAIGLLLFLVATALSGPQVLWDATRSATPVLLMCAAGAFLLANAVLRNDDLEMTRNRVMRLAAWALAAVILPLAVFAAVSMGLRLSQYGLAPKRLWGLAAIVVACAFGVGYWAALARGRRVAWAAWLRQANLHLAAGVCVLAIVLALPLFDFAAISTRNQIARLDSGKVAADDFDYAALRWDFGTPGTAALATLAKRGGKVGELAKTAQAQIERPYPGFVPRVDADFDLTVQPEDPELRRMVLDYLKANPWACDEKCTAIAVGRLADGRRSVALVRGRTFDQVTLPVDVSAPPVALDAVPATTEGPGVVEVRTVERRYIFVDGKPLDRPLDDLEAEAPTR